MNYTTMTDEEFFAEIEHQYGSEWTPEDIKQNKELFAEYERRISTGV